MVLAAEGHKDEKLVVLAMADLGAFATGMVLAVVRGKVVGNNRSKAGGGVCPGACQRDGGFDRSADFSMASNQSQDMVRTVADNYFTNVRFDGFVMV